MKNCFKILLVFILGFIFMPMVNAEIEVPHNGVTYFLEYPNGDEDVYETYDAAMAVNEKLIYEGYTNSNGKISISGLQNWGNLRIVQEVPDGYTTNSREVRVNLAEGNTANFVDYRGLSNPSTGRNMLILLGVVVIVGSSFVIAKKNKKALMIIPIGVCAFALYHVSAWSGAFVITVVDGQGKALNNVRVLVYATPKIETASAVKFDANGGKFFDGSTLMYFRLPSDGCSFDEFLNSLSQDEYHFLMENIENAYKPGYRVNYPDASGALYNGTVLKLGWTSNNNVSIMTVMGNGGTYDFYGRSLDSVSFYEDYGDLYGTAAGFTKENSYLIGFDDNSNCSNYDEHGIVRNYNVDLPAASNERVVYLCWNTKPDGIYVNGSLFGGTDESCFREADADIYSGGIDLYSYDNSGLEVYNEDGVIHFYYYDYSSLDNIISKRINLEEIAGTTDGGDEITSIEIVKNGKTVLSIGQNELSFNNGYIVNNNSKAATLFNYLNELKYNGCYIEEPQE